MSAREKERKIRVRDPREHMVCIRLKGVELAKARRLANLKAGGNLSRLLRYALRKLLEEM